MSSPTAPFTTIRSGSTSRATEPTRIPPLPSFSAPQAPTPTPESPPPAGTNLATSSELYLYTFLATLVLLLSVSSGIVIRSLLMRRRHRRMIEEAIRNGTWPPAMPFSARNGRKDVGETPKMFIASIGLTEEQSGTHEDGKKKGRGPGMGFDSWENLTPVSSLYLNRPSVATATNHDGHAYPVESTPNSPPLSRIPLYLPFFFRRQPPPTVLANPPTMTRVPPTTPPNPTPTTSYSHITSHSTTPSKVQVVVLIAMPSRTPLAHRPPGDGDDEDPPPHVEFGAAEVEIGDASAACGTCRSSGESASAMSRSMTGTTSTSTSAEEPQQQHTAVVSSGGAGPVDPPSMPAPV